MKTPKEMAKMYLEVYGIYNKQPANYLAGYLDCLKYILDEQEYREFTDALAILRLSRSSK